MPPSVPRLAGHASLAPAQGPGDDSTATLPRTAYPAPGW